MNDVLRIARLKIALQRAFLGRAILIFTEKSREAWNYLLSLVTLPALAKMARQG